MKQKLDISKHTKGPWHRNIKPVGRYPIVFAGRNTHVAHIITSGLSAEEAEANCDLITAAPNMLTALKAAQLHMMNAWKANCAPNLYAIGALAEAISEAEGAQ